MDTVAGVILGLFIVMAGVIGYCIYKIELLTRTLNQLIHQYYSDIDKISRFQHEQFKINDGIVQTLIKKEAVEVNYFGEPGQA